MPAKGKRRTSTGKQAQITDTALPLLKKPLDHCGKAINFPGDFWEGRMSSAEMATLYKCVLRDFSALHKLDLRSLFEDEDDARLGGLESALVALRDDRVVGRLGSACGQLGTQLDVGEEAGTGLDLALEERLGVGAFVGCAHELLTFQGCAKEANDDVGSDAVVFGDLLV